MSRNQWRPLYQTCMDELLAIYKRGGFKITDIPLRQRISQSNGPIFGQARTDD
jgi:hypothetical protein